MLSPVVSLLDRIGGRARAVMLALLAYQGFVLAMNGVAAPWMMRTFALDQSGIARLFAVTSVAALGAFLLARLADRLGRRAVLIGCATATPLCALGAAVSALAEPGDPRTSSAAIALGAFAAFDTLMLCCAGATVAIAIVWISEAAAHGSNRPAGQGFGGLATVLGAGPAVLAMPILARTTLSWRLLFLAAGSAVLVLPFLARLLPETGVWLRAAARTADRGVEQRFDAESRRRIRPIVITTFLSTVATAPVDSWRYFHMVTIVGLPPSTASMLLIGCGVVGITGFAIGAASTERAGRVPSVARFVALMAIAIAAAFWGPPSGWRHPVIWLAAAFGSVSFCGNALGVAANTATTELFPTPLRGSVLGSVYLVGALARITAQALVAALAGRVGTVSTVVGLLGLLGIVVAVVFTIAVPETRDQPLPMDAAAPLDGIMTRL